MLLSYHGVVSPPNVLVSMVTPSCRVHHGGIEYNTMFTEIMMLNKAVLTS